MVLLPTDSNKLLLQWKGPFEILEKVRGDDYRVPLFGRTKTFHANMLRNTGVENMKAGYIFHMPWYLNRKKQTKMSLLTSLWA